MRETRKRHLTLVSLLLVLLALAQLPATAVAEDDNDNSEKSQSKDKPATNQQTIVPADARPDLMIEFGGFQNQAVTDQLIKFKVTNVGKARSSAIKAKVITLAPEPTPWQRDLDVASLAPGASVEIFYPLAASCNGHRVLATINDPLDFPSVNDRVEADVCPILPPIVPESPPVIVIAIPEILTPVHLRLGEHKDGGRYPALEIAPTTFRVHGLRQTSEGPVNPTSECDGSTGLPYQPHVGFDYEIGTFCDEKFVFQLILDFDLQWLREIERKLIFRAELLFDEGPMNRSAPHPTCVSRVGQAPANWPEVVTRTNSRNSLTPTLLTTQNLAGDRIAGGWDVTEEIRLTQRPDLADQWHGLVLHGLDENLGSEDEKICISHINNARLKLQYVVL